MTVGEIHAFLQSRAPFETAEPYDNAGLLVGSAEMRADRILVTLDITPAAVQAAVDRGAGLIISHHPVIFHPLRRLPADSIPFRLAGAGIAAICAHTNLDRAAGGVGDRLAETLGLTGVRTAPDGICRIGTLPQPLAPEDFVGFVGRRLGTPVRMREGGAPVERVAVCGGAGGDFLIPLLQEGRAGAAVTGELKHHEWLDLPPGVTVVEAGHYHTEVCMVEGMACWLQESFPEIHVTAFPGEPPYRTI